ncbi:MAG: restriction endonuclease [Gemmatimonadetes bacterium]|nr:restriction endonuclease [Gemmatimonadota bacterium]
MAVWVVRAGAHGELRKFIQESRVYVTWNDLSVDLATMKARHELTNAMNSLYPDSKPNAIRNWVGQVWPFAHEMTKGDLVLVPLKSQRAIQVGEIAGEYEFNKEGPNPFYHYRKVKWIADAVPRANFSQDVLLTLGAFLTIYRVQRNDAEARLAKMRSNGWKPEKIADVIGKKLGEPTTIVEGPQNFGDLEETARDQLASLITARFKGHGLARLVEGVLKAQGYTTYRSPEGADGGADILAGAGPLGFGAPRLCVEVKSEAGPIDRPTVDKLLGAVSKFGAQEGLFVAWGGFKSNVAKELAASFFKVRLWSQDDLLEALLSNYEKLDDELKAELPLRRIWIVAAPESDL